MMGEKGTEIVIVKSDIETLGKKNEHLVKCHQVSVNTIIILEDTVRELKEAMAEKERNNKYFWKLIKKVKCQHCLKEMKSWNGLLCHVMDQE
ncbi:Hypothetical predicted protein [Mytilus galloprovincialis]|uniref:Uncharacterized protein n=1 Tax=Mytilus galloprovincialis TaxID=29158 RepID=A0A8B6G5E3_MYTGA|nr:Hypothetical predicted protein [Mytilus galloprovincialis]